MKTALITLLGEVRKSLLISWTYRANVFVATFTLGFIFVGIGLLTGGGELDSEQLTFMFVGYLVWFYTRAAISDLSWGLRGEMSAGTLEQMSMSPVPIGLVLAGRVFTSLLLTTAQILIQGSVFFLLLDIRIPLRWEGIPILALTLIGVFGFGYIVAGATLVFKQSESLANVVENLLLFINGTMVPLDAMPAWLASIARAFPSTLGIAVLRRVVLDGRSLGLVWQDKSLVWLIVHSSICLAIGWLVFDRCERVAKKQGSLGQY